jgi:hypothetical protein
MFGYRWSSEWMQASTPGTEAMLKKTAVESAKDRILRAVRAAIQ